MSQANSDFADDIFGDAMAGGGLEEQGMVAEPPVEPAPKYRKQGFSIYSVMLILSFIFLTAAAIMFFIDAEKY